MGRHRGFVGHTARLHDVAGPDERNLSHEGAAGRRRTHAGGNTYVDIPISIPAGQPVDRANSLSVSVDVPADPVPSDDAVRFTFRSGPVTDLRATISSAPAIPIGGSGVVTVRVSNDGPDTSSPEAQLEVAFETLPKSKGTVRPVRDGKHRIIQVVR